MKSTQIIILTVNILLPLIFTFTIKLPDVEITLTYKEKVLEASFTYFYEYLGLKEDETLILINRQQHTSEEFSQVINLKEHQVDQFKAQNFHFITEYIYINERINFKPVANANPVFKLSPTCEVSEAIVHGTMFFQAIDQKFFVQVSDVIDEVKTYDMMIEFGKYRVALNREADQNNKITFILIDLFFVWNSKQIKHIRRNYVLPQDVRNILCDPTTTSFTVGQITYVIPDREMIIELCLTKAIVLK
jgi:hypothetical protein